MAKEKFIKLKRVTKDTKEVFELPDGSEVELNEYLVWLGNMVYEIKKSIS